MRQFNRFQLIRHLKSSKSNILIGLTLALWLAVVVFTASRHEYWRDEVRSLSLARAAASPLDLYALTKYDGHPVLWHLLLYFGKSIVDSSLILPVLSISIAFAAVAIFMVLAPFPFWFRTLFIFSALPLYEYAVMARHYGISMLLLFIVAALYPQRSKRPWSLAVILALLANTNIHSAILTALLAAVWAWDILVAHIKKTDQAQVLKTWLPFLVIVSGFVLSIIFVAPDENSAIFSQSEVINPERVQQDIIEVIRHPDRFFPLLVPGQLPSRVAISLLYLAVLGLIGKPNLFLAALGGLFGMGLFFNLIFLGDYRHQGVFLAFILMLYWLLFQSPERITSNKISRVLSSLGLYGAVLLMVLDGTAELKDTVWADIHLERSSSRAFSQFLINSEEYRDAILIPEPGWVIEALPYYVDNKIYFAREQRFGNTVSWTKDVKERLSLSELLMAARDIDSSHIQPVLIVLGHLEIASDEAKEKTYPYHKVFSWTADELANFYDSTVQVAAFESAYTNENYLIFALKNR